MEDILIRVRGVSFGFQELVALKELSLDVPAQGVLLLMGPAGAGKSTLLRTLGRWNDLRPAFWCHGAIELSGQNLWAMPAEDVQRQVALLAQKTRLYTSTVLENAIAEVLQARRLSRRAKLELARDVLEPFGLWDELALRLDRPVVELSIARQRMLAIARLVSGGAKCLLADEPLRDVLEAEQPELQAFIAKLAKRMAVVLVTHNQKVAREMGDHVCLLSGHRLVECGPAAEFFESPQTELGRTFLEFGSCWPSAEQEMADDSGEGKVSEGDASPESLVQASTPSWMPTTQETAHRPGGFHWVLPGRLAGLQRPGLLSDLEADLGALRQMNIRTLVTLTEEPFDVRLLSAWGIISVHFPIVDMDVPVLADASAMCRRLSALIAAGEPVALHCKAGLGRTGTMLACILVYRGEPAVRAVHRVRSVNPLYIQSERQLAFVAEFEAYLLAQRRATATEA